MSNTQNIVILGGSFAGLSVAHYFLKHILPTLPKNNGTSYHVYLIDSSTHYYWRIAAPRALVGKDMIQQDKMFLPIADGFKQYDPSIFTFIQATATSMDTNARTVTIEHASNSESQSIPYHALVIATGTRTPSPLLSLQGDYKITQNALQEMWGKLSSAKTIVIAGGGPAGVETAGEIGEALNGVAGFFQSRPANPKAKITLLSGSNKLLPMLRPALAKQAEVYLNRVGVDVVHNAKMQSVDSVGAQTLIHLDNGSTLEADIYIPATGVKPNSAFVPANLKTDKGYVKTNGKTLRVDEAGPRVYAAGDVGSYTRGGVMDIYDAIPVVLTNIKRDLQHAATSGASSPSSNNNEKQPELAGNAPGSDRTYKANLKETQLVPVGRSKGVGAVFGWKLPTLMVYMIKGRNYMIDNAVTLQRGTKWEKENGWKPTDA
ncbi:hypothetical protein BJ546DRAFT_528581 [Cryomyces antarcticus]|nr:hypothetical protein LTR04_000154 [Oleoguttula sp. CCFEE 6159]